jgi:hypothetical protein
MIKPFEILREDPTADGTVILYKVSKSTMSDVSTKKQITVTSTMFVSSGLDIEAELVVHLRAGGWL